MATTSWVIVSKETGTAVLETFNAKTAAAINRERYNVVPILEWLVSLNQKEDR
jgi:hypothetical protein